MHVRRRAAERRRIREGGAQVQELRARPPGLQGPLSVVAHNRKVVGALSVVGATESQIFNGFLDFSLNLSKNGFQRAII